MNNLPFPWLALGIGLSVAVLLLASGALGVPEGYRLPVLTLLIVNEFGFFVTAIGAGVGINRMLAGDRPPGLQLSVIACAMLACGFVYLATRLWPGGLSLG
jgi:hypothetical protein